MFQSEESEPDVDFIQNATIADIVSHALLEVGESNEKFGIDIDSSQPQDQGPILSTVDGDKRKAQDIPFPSELNMTLDNILIDEIIHGIGSDDPDLQLAACQKLIYPKSDTPLPSLLYSLLDAVIEASLVGRLLKFMSPYQGQDQDHDETSSRSHDGQGQKLAIAAAWVITTLARTNPKLLVDNGAISQLLKLIRPDNQGPCLPAAYALSALATTSGGSDNRLFVNQIRDAGIISILVETVRGVLEEADLNLPLILALSKLARSICYVPKNVRITGDRMALVKSLCDIYNSVPESELDIYYHCSWGLYYLTKSGNESIIQELVHERGAVIEKLVRTVGTAMNHLRLLRPCLNVVGNIISSTVDSHTDAVLFAGILPHLHALILEPRWTGVVNWIVSNIAAGNPAQKEELFQAGFFPLILDVFRSGHLTGAKEAIYTILNIMDKGSLHQKQFLLNNGVLSLLIALLKEHPDQVFVSVLDTIYLLVMSFDFILGDGSLQNLLNESGTLMELSKYQDDENSEVRDRVCYILNVGLNQL